MNSIKYIDLTALECYHKKLMEHINLLVINKAFEYSTCPNCAAIITSDKCDFCGTLFRKRSESYEQTTT